MFILNKNKFLSELGENIMGPIRHSLRQLSLSSQLLNVRNTSFKTTSQASYLVKKLIDKVSLGILNAADARDDKSKVVSSTSLAPVLGMLLASMDDKARKASVLGISKEDLTDKMETEIHKKLGEFSVNHPYAKDPDQKQALSCSNFIGSTSALGNEKLNQTLSECYHTEKLECHDHDRCLADVAEDYVKEKTNGKIEKLFHGHSKARRELIKAVIGHVMEFDGIWKDEFSEDKTVHRPFNCANGSFIRNVKMMSSTEELQFVETSEFDAIGKEFQSLNGEDLKLVAIQPHFEDPEVINKLDSETINHLIERLNDRKVKMDLRLPKIKIENSCDTRLLDKISEVFGTNIIKAADLTRLGDSSDGDLEILQKTKVSIGEKGAYGTVATAATTTLRDPSSRPSFEFNYPGYIAIVDGQGNRLLEMVIKDGSFFELGGTPEITPAGKQSSDNQSGYYDFDMSDSEDDMPDSDYNTEPKIDLPTKIRLVQEDLSAIKRLSFDFFETVNVSNFIKDYYDPDGKLEIKSAMADDKILTLEFFSSDDAKDLKERILKSIGEEYRSAVKIYERDNPVEIIVNNNTWHKMIAKITSGQS
ncbi:serpin family protein [Endozoicomonas sp. ALC020]|uniref:serpin family protein n=1 Tax=unclassified Endozoicomonas TaxID=2644528 RepID=UPI003BAE57DA